MSASITFLVYRLEWHRRRAEAMQSARAGLYRDPSSCETPSCETPSCETRSCKIFWAADSFAHRGHAPLGPTVTTQTREGASIAGVASDLQSVPDLQSEPD